MKINLKCTDFRPYENKTLKGYATLVLEDSGVIIDGYALHEKNGGRWLSLPRRSYVKNGETVYADMMTYASAEAKQGFQKTALEALDSYLRDRDGDDVPL